MRFVLIGHTVVLSHFRSRRFLGSIEDVNKQQLTSLQCKAVDGLARRTIQVDVRTRVHILEKHFLKVNFFHRT
jgi:hypothetical protein